MKRIIICCDGTWNSDDDDATPTNVLKLSRLLVQRDDGGVHQQVIYRRGVGADGSATGLARLIDRVGGGAFGWGLDANILDVYRRLVLAYEPGDELWLFGFSRGAYTARSIAGLLRNCGILRREYLVLANMAIDLYRARDAASHPDAPRSVSFRQRFAHEIESIHFIGVWDTVGSLGVPAALGPISTLWNFRYRFHDVGLSRSVQHAYHAVAIDEVRRAFAPTLWTWKGGDGDVVHEREGVEQVWFAGVHSDVGGGYVASGLSEVALAWMIDKARACGLAFDDERIAEELAPDPLGILHDSRWRIHRLPGTTRPRAINPDYRQFIHQCAIVRVEQHDDYDPPNLREALDHMPVTGEPPQPIPA